LSFGFSSHCPDRDRDFLLLLLSVVFLTSFTHRPDRDLDFFFVLLLLSVFFLSSFTHRPDRDRDFFLERSFGVFLSFSLSPDGDGDEHLFFFGPSSVLVFVFLSSFSLSTDRDFERFFPLGEHTLEDRTSVISFFACVC